MGRHICLADDFSAWFAGYSGTWKPEVDLKTLVTSSMKLEATASDCQSFELPAIVAPSENNGKSESAKSTKPVEFTPPDNLPSSSLTSILITTLPTSPPSPETIPNLAPVSAPASAPVRRPTLAELQEFTTEWFATRKSKKGGIGAFAIKDIPKDMVILSERALFRAIFADLFYEYENLSRKQLAEFHSLFGWSGIDPHPVIAIYKTNRFSTTDRKGGIFVKSSRFNHQCHPYASCTYRYDDDQKLLITKTLRDIKEGEEITISYGGSTHSLYKEYGFWCDCPKCPALEVARKEDQYPRGAF